MTSTDSGTTVYIGNLKSSVRILELKTSLQKLLVKTLKVVNISLNDISIVNGPKRYAIIDVHNEQNVEYILQKLRKLKDRQKVKFNFESLEEEEGWLHVDTVKCQDDKQTRDDYEGSDNLQHPFQRPHRHVRKRPDYGHPVAIKSTSTPSHAPAVEGRLSEQGCRIQETHAGRQSPEFCASSDLDVTLEDSLMDSHRDKSCYPRDDMGEAFNRPISMIALDDSTLKVYFVIHCTEQYFIN